MQKLSFILLISLLFAACQSTGEQQLRELQPRAEDKVRAFLDDPQNLNDIAGYTPVSFEPLRRPDHPDSGAYELKHRYKGLNVASREVRREVIFYFDEDLNILRRRRTRYLDPLTKEQLKQRSS